MTWLIVRAQDGRIILRIEDLDRARSKPEFTDQVQRDLQMLGLTWDEGPYFQQGREETYAVALAQLCDVYPCFCTRADLHAASAPHAGEKLVYAGTCRNLSEQERAARTDELEAGRAPALRLSVPDVDYAVCDIIQGPFAQNLARECGDFIVQRANGEYAYQLACVVDDAEQGMNLVVRGVDLLDSAPQQRFLQDELGLPHVEYAHVPLLVAGESGCAGANEAVARGAVAGSVSDPDAFAQPRRLSKRDKDASLQELLARFGSPEGIIGHIAFLAGITELDAPISNEELLALFIERGGVSALPELLPSKSAITWR